MRSTQVPRPSCWPRSRTGSAARNDAIMLSAREIGRALDLRGARGACPVCGQNGALVLLNGRSRPPLPWCHYGCDPRAVREAVFLACGNEIRAPLPTPDKEDHERKRVQARKRACKLWRTGTTPIGTAVERYLAKRGLPRLERSDSIRFRPDTPHPAGGCLPAMLALVTDATGKPAGLHRTFLTPDGRKALVEPVKASLGPVWGGAIRLDPEAPELVIGEGIETSASAGRLLNLPAWAAINAGNLERGLMLPSAVRTVVIAADADVAGERAATAAAARWQVEGRRVRIARPSDAGDFNDVLRACAEAIHAA